MRVIWLLFILAAPGVACSKPAPMSIEQLRETDFAASLTVERVLEDGPGFSAYLVSYRSSGLKVHALVAVPDSEKPSRGYPVLIANHGHHPDPPNYGITADGVDSRPGDYYRDIPALFTAHGFMVVMPDYRGHSDSEGFEFTDGLLEASYYAEDVMALLSAIDDLEFADTANVFMWAHSMGSDVSMRVLVATDRIRGASLWSSVGGEIWDQAYYYARYTEPTASDSSGTAKESFDKLRSDIGALEGEYDWRTREPLNYLDDMRTPVILHHAIGDRGAAYKWSERLAKEFYLRGIAYEFHSYEGSAHLFDPGDRAIAASRDVEFFRALMQD